MNCLVCGEEIKEGKKFCTQCGAPVGEENKQEEEGSEAIVVCIACEKPIKRGAKFCNYCGSSQVVQEVEESEIEAFEEANEGNERINPIEEKNVNQYHQKIDSKKYKQRVLAGIGVFGIVAVAMGISAVSGKQGEKSYLQGYQDESGKTYIQMEKGEFVKINASEDVRISHDGKVVFYQDEDELYYIKAGEREQEVSDEVLSYQISKDGQRVSYIQGESWGDRVGELIYHSVGKSDQVIEKEAYIGYNTLSPNGKYVAYVTGIDLLTEEFGKAKGKVYSENGEILTLTNINKVYKVNDKGMVLGKKMKSNFSLYEREIGDVYLENGKESTKIATNIEYIRTTPALDKIYMIDEKGKLYCYEKNKLTQLADKVAYMSMYKVNEDKMTVMYADDKGRLNIVLENGETCKVGDDLDISEVRYSVDHKRIMYMEDDDLYYGVKSSSDFKTHRIAKEVSQWEMTLKGTKGIYITDGELFSFEGTKEPQAIEKNVKFAKISEQGDIWFIDKKNNLWYTDGKKEPKEIFEDVYEMNTPMGSKIGVLNTDGEFYEFNKTKQLKEIADDVEYIGSYFYQDEFWTNY